MKSWNMGLSMAKVSQRICQYITTLRIAHQNVHLRLKISVKALLHITT
jgi:hypothetical protein